MANPPDSNDNPKNIKADRNLANPSGIKPPAPEKKAEPAPVDTKRAPKPENLAAKPATRAPDSAVGGTSKSAPTTATPATNGTPNPAQPPAGTAVTPPPLTAGKSAAESANAAAKATTPPPLAQRSRLEKPAAPAPRVSDAPTRDRPSRPLTRPESAAAPRVASDAPQARAPALPEDRDGRRLRRPIGPPPGHPDRLKPMRTTRAADAFGPSDHQERRPPPRATRPGRRMRPPVGANPVGRYVNRPAPVSAPLYHPEPASGGSFGPLLFGLLLLAAVGWLAIKHYTPTIQQDLVERSRASLDSAGFADNTEVSIDGRNITIDGTVASAEESQRAEEAVAGTFGVRSVNNNLTVGEAESTATSTGRDAPTFSIIADGDNITLSGTVSDQKFADALAAMAEEQYDGQITNTIEVDVSATNPGWTAAVSQLVPDLKQIDNGAISISGDTATLSGIAADIDTKTALGEKATALLGTQLDVVNDIEAPGAVAPSLPAFASVSETEDEITLNGFMSAEGAATVAQAYSTSGKTVVNNISVNELAESPAWIDSFNSALATLEGVQDGKLTIARSGTVRLQGIVETDEQKQAIGTRVADLFGADTAMTNSLEVVPPPVVPTMQPFASVSQTADTVTISGLLPEQAANDLLDSYNAPDLEINNRITIDERVMSPEWLDALIKSRDRLGAVKDSSIRVASNGTITVNGEANSEQAKKFTSINLRTLFGNALELQNDISVAVTPTPQAPAPEAPTLTPFVTVKHSPDALTISGLLPEQAANTLVEAYSGSAKTLTNNITVDSRVMQPAWADALGQSVDRLETIDNGGINIASNGTLSLQGEVETEQAKQFAAINFGTLFGDSVSLRNELTVKTPTIAEPPKPDVQALLGELDLSGIRFRSGSAELDDNSIEILEDVYEVLSLVSDAQILIAGHTDSRGNTDFNFSLSADRADAVQQFLVNRGISAERLTAQGFGPAQPIASNDTAAGRALNRRIEIQLIGE